MDDHGKMTSPGKAATLLRALRERLNGALTMSALAEAIGAPYASGYQRYETKYKRPYLPIELLIPLSRAFVKHGIPPEDLAPLWGVPVAAVQEALPEYEKTPLGNPALALNEHAAIEAYIATRRAVRAGILTSTSLEDEARTFLKFYLDAVTDRDLNGSMGD